MSLSRLVGLVVLAAFALSVPNVAAAKSKKKHADEDDQNDDDDSKDDKKPKSGYGAAADVVALGGGGQGAGVEAWKQSGEMQWVGQVLYTAGSDTGGSSSDASGGSLDETISIKSVLVGVKLRKFFGGTFYIAPALNYAMMSGDYGFKVSGGDSTTTSYTASGLWATFGVGNQWQTKSGWVIGCDWAGVGDVLGLHVSADTNSTDGQAIDALSQLAFNKGAVDRITDNIGTNLYRFYLLQLHIGKVF